ncbi:MAG: glycoside hydrolase family 3 C-terminal domain-containing protein [Clostridia bacterium]|nr:glycoside hydrolase family 3 C-terminal domain-containing protein [Clostridia bacterium]
MTVEEKIGQLEQFNAIYFGHSDAEITGPLQKLGVAEDFMPYVGSVLNFHGADEMIAIQKKHLAEDPNKIPLLFMMDVIHGYRTIHPIPLALGASFDPETVAECTRMASKEASSGGIQLTFTPMVDYVRDARWGRVMETCGEDPYLNSVMGATQVRAFQGDDLRDPENLATCVKHYAAYGGAEAGRDYNTVEISERLLRECYLPAYKACIDAGTTMLMPSFNSLNGVPSIANPWLMQQVLKNEWGFEGVVISDYNAIGELLKHGITDSKKEAARLAFENGCDIEMMSPTYYLYLRELVEEGTFSMEQLDAAVMRVLRLKEALGLFEDPFRGASAEKEAAICLTPEHRAIARRAAEASAVLLKNDGILPLSESTKKIALVGPFADSNAIKGFWACCGKDEDCVTIREGISALLPDAEITAVSGCSAEWNECSREGFAEAIEAAKNADVVVFCVGEPQKYSGEGNSRADLTLPGVQEELIAEVLKVNKNAVAVVFSGRPLVLTNLDATVPAILEMWFPGTEGGSAVANLLFGRANPSGKVSMSFPKAVGQCPIYYNHPTTGRPKTKPEDVHQGYASNYIGCGNLPLYSFGHGLSYTTFEYTDMTLDRTEMTKDDTLTVRVTLKNTGDRTGKEVVQLYLRDLYASAVRPVASLIGVSKVELAPGEETTVTFDVTEEMLRFYDLGCNFISEKGDFTLSVGYADHMAITKGFRLV